MASAGPAEQEKTRDELAHLIFLNNLVEVRELLNDDQFLDVLNLPDHDPHGCGRTALHVGVQLGNLEMVQLLCEKGADMNALDKCFWTPWRLAMETNKHDIAEWLEQNNAETWEQESEVSIPFVCLVVLIQAAIIFLYAMYTDYDATARGGDDNTDTDANLKMKRLYPVFQDVHVMIFIGFGFLMTFLRRHQLGSVSFTLFVAAFTIQWSILVNGFWHRLLGHHETFDDKINLSVEILITGDFAAGAVLITYGALLGKVSPLQMVVLALLECIFYGLNEAIGVGMLEAVDMGGSMMVHLFGAMFGITASLVLTDKQVMKQKALSAAYSLAGASYESDTFAMIGTVFLWMFWPSFNGALATGTSRQRVVVNTVLALTGSATNAFLASHVFNHGKFSMVDIQNATLAGGVAVGSSCDLVVGAWPAIVIGSAAGIISVIGFNRLQGDLARSIGLHDTCGVLNLHGIPGIIGAVSGAISASLAGETVYGEDVSSMFPARGDGRTANEQGYIQALTLVITLGISLSSGALCGFIVKLASPRFLNPPGDLVFRDSRYIVIEDPDLHPLPLSFLETEDMLTPEEEEE